MRQCCVLGCGSKEGRMHRFPSRTKKEAVFREWVLRIGRPEILRLSECQIYSSKYVCAKHFDSCLLNFSGRLFPATVPTLCLPYPVGGKGDDTVKLNLDAVPVDGGFVQQIIYDASQPVLQLKVELVRSPVRRRKKPPAKVEHQLPKPPKSSVVDYHPIQSDDDNIQNDDLMETSDNPETTPKFPETTADVQEITPKVRETTPEIQETTQEVRETVIELFSENTGELLRNAVGGPPTMEWLYKTRVKHMEEQRALEWKIIQDKDKELSFKQKELEEKKEELKTRISLVPMQLELVVALEEAYKRMEERGLVEADIPEEDQIKEYYYGLALTQKYSKEYQESNILIEKSCECKKVMAIVLKLFEGRVLSCPNNGSVYCTKCVDLLNAVKHHMDSEHPNYCTCDNSERGAETLSLADVYDATALHTHVQVNKSMRCVLEEREKEVVRKETLKMINNEHNYFALSKIPKVIVLESDMEQTDVDESNVQPMEEDNIQYHDDIVATQSKKPKRNRVRKRKAVAIKNVGEFCCNICYIEFSSKPELRTHKRTHLNCSTYLCSVCRFRTLLKEDMMIHLVSHTGESPASCPTCNETVKHRTLLPIHAESHGDGEKEYSCDSCYSVFNCKILYREHVMKSHMGQFNSIIGEDGKMKFVCRQCNKEYKTEQCLHWHQQMHHEHRYLFQCKVCYYKFTEEGLIRHNENNPHVAVESRTYVCDICDVSFSNNCLLRVHRTRIHKRSKRHVCYCGAAYYCNSHLQRHQSKHTGVKVFLCTVCGKSFSESKYLKRHSFHHTGERNYACDVCQKCFVFNCDLAKHKKQTHGPKPFMCDICSKGFSYQHILITHMASCTGIYKVPRRRSGKLTKSSELHVSPSKVSQSKKVSFSVCI